MSYWLEDADGKYLGDLATNVGINQLRKASLGPLALFLDVGEADGDLIQAIQEEALAVPSVAYVADLLEGAKAPVYVTDGCGHEDDLSLEDKLQQLADNVFCPTGPGGGQDNSCGKEGGKLGEFEQDKVRKKQEMIAAYKVFANEAEKTPSDYPYSASVYRDFIDKAQKEIEQIRGGGNKIPRLPRVQQFNDLKPGDFGRGAFLMPDGSLIDITQDFGGGTNDHVGMFVMAENPTELGITKSLALKISKEAETGEYEAIGKAWEKVRAKGIVRVRHFKDFDGVALDFGEGKYTPSQAYQHVLSGKLPRVKEYAFDEVGGSEGTASLDQLKSSPSWDAIARRRDSLVSQFHTNQSGQTLADQLSQILNHSQPEDDGRLSDDDLRRILYHKKERTAQ